MSIPSCPDSSDDRVWWLALYRAPGLGNRSFRALVERWPDPRSVFDASLAELAKLGIGDAARTYLASPDWSRVESDLKWLARPDCHLVTFRDAAYPSPLQEIADAPPVLFVEGNPKLLSCPQLAVVGSRNPTATGRDTAHAFGKALAQMGFVVTSGLATGIDGAAHQGALAGGGSTIAVAANGPDQVYPPRHRELAKRIALQGAIVTEFPPGTPPLPKHFPRRNRIISGLALGVLVVEATRRSGSLITARLAAEQGREVFAVPGSIHSPLSRGCHMLLREGAKLVEQATDILEELGPQDFAPPDAPDAAGKEPIGPGFEFDDEYQLLMENLGFEPTPVDAMVERTGLTAEVVSSMLLTLELRGYVSSVSGGRYARTVK